MNCKIILSFFVLTSFLYPQQNSFLLDFFSGQLSNGVLEVTDTLNSTVLVKSFNNPTGYTIDLDEDNRVELLIIDSLRYERNVYYTVYMYSTLDSFHLVDSIYSGLTHPYQIFSNELNGIIVVTGDSRFDYFNQNDVHFSPVNCWRCERGELFLVNDELYEIFISENEPILRYLNNFFRTNPTNCASSNEVLGAITSAYANYYNAGEVSAADRILKKYYLCGDINAMKLKLTGYLNE